MEVVRLRCEHLQDVPILGIGTGASRVYLAHAQNLVSLLKGNLERSGACRAFNTFLQSTAGRVIRDGGELASASLPLDKMMYSYHVQKSGRGSASRFVTLEGAKEIVQKLPGVSDEMKAKLSPFLEADVMSFEEVTPEQCQKEDAQAEIEALCIGGSGGGYNGDAMMCEQTTMVPWKVLNEYRVSLIESEAERKYLRGRLDLEEERKRLCQASKATEIELAVAKEHVDRVEAMAKEQLAREKERSDRAEAAAKEQVELEKERATMAEAVAKERFEREKLQQQTAFLQEKAAMELKMKELEQAAFEARMKELEAANARMQLELEKARSAGSGEGGSSSGGKTRRKRAQELALETEDDEEEQVEPIPRAEAVKVVLPEMGEQAQSRWLVAYEGDVELTFFRVQAKVPSLVKIESARFDGLWFSLLRLKKRLRSASMVRAMHTMGLAASVWVEAFAGCTTWVGFNIPVCNELTPSSEHILMHMRMRQRAPAQFAMVVVK
jgi:hypothetical protein